MQRHALTVLFLIALAALDPIPLQAQNSLAHHVLKATVIPEEHLLRVIDTITLPQGTAREFAFFLHAGLTVSSPTPGVRIEKQSEQQAAVPLASYVIRLPRGLRTIVLAYEGAIHHPLTQTGAEQARGFEETPGTISSDGIFLSGASGWYPDLRAGLMTFDLTITLPAPWEAVSQGERVLHDHKKDVTTVRWRSPEPQDEIYLVANTFTQYSKTAGQATAMVFLRSPDAVLANKYLDATASYITMYSDLIGPYPYKKFALVENFWETGFGMPSFTLLGPKVVRLPFIINSSYPHEILHNWWGNSVYPDLAQGNWSEGLTAYLADHLLKEQQHAGAEYRVNTLQKYADYVLGNRDFPLTQFRSRHSSSSEAVGYGKSLMFFHMLRREIGDPAFIKGIRSFYQKYRYQSATFDNIRASFEAASGRDLKALFDQWINRSGAPQLRLGKADVTQEGGHFVLHMLLDQVQSNDPYQMKVPVAVTLEGRDKAYQTSLEIRSPQEELSITLPARPLRLDIDPQYDLFRRLDREEIPPAISQALGAKNMLIILPDSAERKLLDAYRAFAEGLGRSGPDSVEVKLDSDVKELPLDRTIAVLGWENRFLKEMLSTVSLYGVLAGSQSILLNRHEVPLNNHSFVLSSRIPGNSDMAMLFVATDLPEALPGLGQKLPHYHKYSYLAFEGQEPANVEKGRWPVLNSPMALFLPNKDGNVIAHDMAGLAPREPLTDREQIFSRDKMMGTVRSLANVNLAGRGFGSPGLDKAAELIAREFKQAGLRPGGDQEGSWFQVWEDSGGDPLKKTSMKNVIGVLPGKREDGKQQSIVIGAHYDHLGTGWPETRDPSRGKVHPGADDNASGVAVMIELARVLAKGPRLDRTIVFVAFTGEEAGRRGSKYYVANQKQYPAGQCTAMINLDTVGRLGKNKLLVLGSASAREWVHIFRGAGFVTGVDLDIVSAELDSSDQKSFQEAGIPAVQLFSGPHLDYHRSTDTADKIDSDGLVKVASVAKEAAEYLADRTEALTTAGKQENSAGSSPKTERKVSIGTVPDFAYSGKGFRLSGVVPGYPAEAAGLKEGDIIVKMNSIPVEGLQGFSNILKTLKPGDRVTIELIRDGKASTMTVEVKER